MGQLGNIFPLWIMEQDVIVVFVLITQSNKSIVELYIGKSIGVA